MSILGDFQRRSQRRAAKTGVVFQSRNWSGVFDAPDVTPLDTKYLADAMNVFFPFLEQSGGVWTRPIWTQKTASQLGAANTRLGQCIHEHVRADGTRDRLVFLGGKMYSWDGATTFTDITPATTTISSTARIFCCSFNEKIIVSDGVNKPWAYNPVAATRAFIDVDGSGTAWVAQGPPVVYAAKLFFIIASKSATTYASRIIWSEEIDETLGYVQTGGATKYTNKWDLSQTSNDPLRCLIATNVGLYYFRSSSIGFIAGQVNAAFQTTATHDAISTVDGTTAPASVIVANGYIWFLNQLGRPCRFALGSAAIQTIWAPADSAIRAIMSSQAVSDLARIGAAIYSADTNLVLFTLVGNAANNSAALILVYDAELGRYEGKWTLQTNCAIDVLGHVTDSSGYKVVAAVGSNSSTVNDGSRGHVWRLSNTAEPLPYGDTGVASYIVPRVASEKPMQEFRFHRATLESTYSAGLTYTVTTAAPSVGDASSTTATSSTPTTEIGVYGTMRTTVGCNIAARGFRIKWAGGPSGTSSVPHVFMAVEVDAVPLSRAVGGQ